MLACLNRLLLRLLGYHAKLGNTGPLDRRHHLDYVTVGHRLICFEINCFVFDLFFGNDLVKAAMSVGAAGATIIKLKHVCPSDSELSKISPAREECNLIVGENQVSDIADAIEKAGGFDDKTHGRILAHHIPIACTYLGGKK